MLALDSQAKPARWAAFAIRDLGLKAGLKGCLYWTYDCAEQKDSYYATEDSGLLLKKLQRLLRQGISAVV